MLPGGYTAVLQARNRDEFKDEVVRFAQRLGFETVSAVTLVQHGVGRSDVVTVDNTPKAYAETYFDPKIGRRDPVVRHCRSQTVPIIWDQSTYVDHGAGDLWEHQARYGYRTGIAMALHLPDGKHFVLGWTVTRPCPTIPRNCSAWWPTCSSSPCMRRTPRCASWCRWTSSPSARR